MERNNGDMIIKSSTYVSFERSAIVEPRQRISNLYIYLYVSDQFVFIGERTKAHWDKSPLGQKPTGQYPTGQKPTA